MRTLHAATLHDQAAWSHETFGPGYREGTLKHLELEIEEIREDPSDVEEYADALILLFDDAMRAGHTPEQIFSAYHLKMVKNRNRVWPDWRTQPSDEPICHDRSVPEEPIKDHASAMHELKRLEYGT